MKEEILQDITDAQGLLEPIVALAFHYPVQTFLIGGILIIAFKLFLKHK